MSRRLVVRSALQVAALGAVAALTVALTGVPASGAFTAVTGNGADSVGTAASFCVSPGPRDVVVANDAWTDEAAPATANGTTAALRVRSGGIANRRSYLRFPLSVPHRCELVSAELRLFNRVPSPGRIIDVYRADPAQNPQWGAGSLNWMNQPAPAGTRVGGTAPGAAGLQTWNVTAHVSTLLSGPNNGFVLLDRQEGQNGPFAQAYDEQSTAGGTAPSLRLTWG